MPRMKNYLNKRYICTNFYAKCYCCQQFQQKGKLEAVTEEIEILFVCISILVCVLWCFELYLVHTNAHAHTHLCNV